MTKLHKNCVEVKVTFPSGKVAIFPSIAEAARHIPVSRQEINRYLSGEYQTCRKGFEFEAV